jgi:hypothetical protein
VSGCLGAWAGAFTFTGLERQEVRLSAAGVYLAPLRTFSPLLAHSLTLLVGFDSQGSGYNTAYSRTRWVPLGRSLPFSPTSFTHSHLFTSISVDRCSQRLRLRYHRFLHSCRWSARCQEKHTRKRSCRWVRSEGDCSGSGSLRDSV